MFRVQRLALLCVVVLVGMTVGCQKHVQLKINNLTSAPLEVEVRAPSIGWVDLGPIPPGAMLKYDLKIDQQDLPAQCSATGGKHTIKFSVAKETESPLYIDFKGWGPPQVRDKHTKVDEKVDEKTRDVPLGPATEVIE